MESLRRTSILLFALLLSISRPLAVTSESQNDCTMCTSCDNPCHQSPVVPSPPPPSPPPPHSSSPACPPPPSPPSPGGSGGGSYYYSPPPPPYSGGGGYYPPPNSGGYYPPPNSGGYYPPPKGGGSYPTPPPNPIVPYFPFYYYSPPPPSLSGANCYNKLMGDSYGMFYNAVVLLISFVVLFCFDKK